MQQFIKHFQRERAGVWVCVERATLHLPQGRIQAIPGTRFVLGSEFMNVDIARLLDDEYSREKDDMGDSSPESAVASLEEGFVRLRDGEWFCRAPISFYGPMGLVNCTPGVVYRKGQPFLGLDIANALDDWESTGRLPPNIAVHAL